MFFYINLIFEWFRLVCWFDWVKCLVVIFSGGYPPDLLGSGMLISYSLVNHVLFVVDFCSHKNKAVNLLSSLKFNRAQIKLLCLASRCQARISRKAPIDPYIYGQ